MSVLQIARLQCSKEGKIEIPVHNPMPYWRTKIRILFLLMLFLISCDAVAQSKAVPFRTRFPRKVILGQQTLICSRVKTPPIIDGEVDKDPVWHGCNRTQGVWVQMGTKKASSRQTVVYTCFDNKSLYFGFVCEETDFSRVDFEKGLASGDSVEVLLEIGGLHGLGDTYAFQANRKSRAQSWGLTMTRNRQRPDAANMHPWRSAGKFGPNRWMVEMAIPFSSLQRSYSQKRISTPQRGDLIGVKFARYGRTMKTGEERMISTPNVTLAYPFLYMCGHNALLYFEDNNVLKDGHLTSLPGSQVWKTAGQGVFEKGQKQLLAGTTLTQTVNLQSKSYYHVTVETKGRASLAVSIADKSVPLDKENQGGIWIEEGNDAAIFKLRAATLTKLRKTVLRYEPGEEPPGPMCLTNNYRTPSRNIKAKLKNLPSGKYKYVKIDYAGHVLKDDNPAFYRKPQAWSYAPHLRVEDLGGTEGWIPFSKGSLTGRPESIFWQTVNPAIPVGWGRHRQVVVDVDLGQEYFVIGLDVLWPAPYSYNMEIWGKPEDGKHWTLLHMDTGEYVEPSKRKEYRRGYDSTRSLDSVVRYVRFRGTQGAPIYPQMDGIQELWVWGEPKANRSGMKVFKPWISPKVVPPAKSRTWTCDRKSAQIIPPPKKLNKKEGMFVINGDTAVIYQDAPDAKKIAAQIQNEIKERWAIQIPVINGKNMGPDRKNMIYLGQPRLGGTARTMAIRENMDVDSDRFPPQGYGINVSPERAVILGRDDEGLYWGAQSLMMAMRWNQSVDKARTGPSVQAMRILDWPDHLERGVYGWRGYAVMFTVPFSEIDRVKRMCRLFSRFKFNAFYLESSGYDKIRWPKGTMAKLCREMRSAYHLEIRPAILHVEKEGAGQWVGMIQSNDRGDLAEVDPDESPKRLTRSMSMNFCPLNPDTYKYMFRYMDTVFEDFGYPSKVMIWGMAYGSTEYGARWGQCRTCQRSGKTLEELYAYYLHRIAEQLEKRRVTGLLHSKWLLYAPSPSKHQRVSLHPSMIPDSLHIDLKCFDGIRTSKGASPETHKEFLKEHFDPVKTTNGPRGWPSMGRFSVISNTMPEIINQMCGGKSAYGGVTSLPAELAVSNWHADRDGETARALIGYADLSTYINSWWYGRDFPSWRNGDAPKFMPIDFRPFANHLSHPTGQETLEPGRAPEIDLRYVPIGDQMLGGVKFNVIDPKQNHGKAILMLGRPPDETVAAVKDTIGETAGPFPVNRKLASLAFLRGRWRCTIGGQSGWQSFWLRPTCRVVYDDDTWLVVDSFIYPHSTYYWPSYDRGAAASGLGFCYRLGWEGNAPSGKNINLLVAEWVNPYPEKAIKALDFFTLDMEDSKSKRVNPMCEAIVAITGIEPVERDFVFWSHKDDRTPLLPPLLPRPDSTMEARESPTRYRVSNGRWKDEMATSAGKIAYKATLLDNSGFCSFQARFPCIYTKSFLPFGVSIEFDKLVRFSHVEILGPAHHFEDARGATAPRKQKVDVRVEISADGKTWTKAAELKGISAQADFLPVDLPDPIKSIRFTGTAKPYHAYYRQMQIVGFLFDNLSMQPHFSWRFFVKKKPKDNNPGRKG